MGTISFTHDIIAPVATTAEMLGDNIEDVLPAYAPSIIGKAISDGTVRIEVEKNHPFWTPELEELVREHVTTFTDSTGARCRFIVNYTNQPAKANG